MPVTTRSNLIVPEVLADAVAAAWPGKIALYGTEAVVESNTLPGGLRGTDTIKVPYFNVFGELSDITEGSSLTPQAISMVAETAQVQHSGALNEITAWAQIAAMYADPYTEITNQLIEAARRRFDKALIDSANATTPSSGQITVNRNTATISYDALVDAVMAFGDEISNASVVVFHSKVFSDVLKLKDTTGNPLVNWQNNTISIGPIALRYILSDRAPVITGAPNNYVTLLIKRGALALWYNRVPTVVRDYDIAKDSELFGVHVYFVAHRYGRLPGSSAPGVVRLITQ
ncbi:MAG: phage major capsid protein [Meiothermus ruber]|uniref:phage major capsid protein n=1 Tax=Meiothermus sp. TaxID=1955249 RepID=UPI0025DEEE2E|nr:phage major capsid protein [Meiothermus sp.]MCS7069089.1 phage major capsid protein [Meiothermus sp.]MCX7802270.1 phage major capsid protein [Meiothermus ruber]